MMPAGRPKEYTNEVKVRLCAEGRTSLQKDTDRRAIVNLLVDNKGIMTLGEIDAHFGFDIRRKVVSLIRAGWLEAIDE